MSSELSQHFISVALAWSRIGIVGRRTTHTRFFGSQCGRRRLSRSLERSSNSNATYEWCQRIPRRRDESSMFHRRGRNKLQVRRQRIQSFQTVGSAPCGQRWLQRHSGESIRWSRDIPPGWTKTGTGKVIFNYHGVLSLLSHVE